MTGLWLRNGELRLADDLEVPSPPPGEALVRVSQAGICNTDLELVRGYYPFDGIPGHEFVGVVEASPAGFEHLEGERVVGEINAVCGACSACSAGRKTHCAHRTVLGIVNRNGAFAEYLTLPAENLHVVPDDVPDDAAVFAEPLAAALQIQEQVGFRAEDRVVVVGDGKLGQLIARTLALTGCSLCVVGRHPGKLAMLSARGIDTLLVDDVTTRDATPPGNTVTTNDTTPSDDAEATGNERSLRLRDFDVAVECTGNASGFDLARRALRPRGTLVLKSTYADRLTLDASRLVVDEINVVGSRCGPFTPAVRLLSQGTVGVEELIAARFPLSAGIEAFERAQQRGTLKVLVQVDGKH